MASRDFTLIWFGQGVSSVGTAITTLAFPLLAILDLHAGAWQIGVLGAVTYGAYALLALPVGAWLDRRSRRPIVIAADLGRMIAIGSVPVAHAFGVLSFAQLVVVAALVGALRVAFDVAYQSWLPALVGPADLLGANATLGATESAGQLLGPGVAGLLIASIGAAYTLGLDALSFLVAACASITVLTREAPIVPLPASVALRDEIRDGIHWLWHAPTLRRIAACSATANFFIAVWVAVETIFLVNTVHAHPVVIGAIFAVGGFGGVLGGVFARRLIQRLGAGRALFCAIAIGGVVSLLAPLGTLVFGAWVVGISQFGVSATLAVYNAGAVSLRQQSTPTELLARVTSANRVLSFGALPIGALSGGLLAAAAGPRSTLVVAALGYGAAAGWLRKAA